jgi:hypothetical protein
MSGEPENTSARFSRRSLLRSAVGATGFLAATLNSVFAQPKISKVAVNYQDHPDGEKRCDKCVQFQPPDACKVVDGTISPQGSCRIFVLSHSAS